MIGAAGALAIATTAVAAAKAQLAYTTAPTCSTIQPPKIGHATYQARAAPIDSFISTARSPPAAETPASAIELFILPFPPIVTPEEGAMLDLLALHIIKIETIAADYFRLLMRMKR